LEEAFAFVEKGRVLSQTDVLRDGRIEYRDPKVASAIAGFIESRTASVAAAALLKLKTASPKIASLVGVSDADALSGELGPEQAVLIYRLTYKGLIIFVLDEDGLQAEIVPIDGKKMRRLIREYGLKMASLAELGISNRSLSKIMIEPIADRISARKELAIVVSGLLRYVAFPALQFDEKSMILDRFLTVHSLSPKEGVAGLQDIHAPMVTKTVRAFSPSDSELDLPFAQKELALIKEVFPAVVGRAGNGAAISEFTKALNTDDAIVHFAGHFELDGRDPMASELQFADGSLKLYEFLSAPSKAELIVLSACESKIGLGQAEIGQKSTGHELLSLAEAFLLGGAKSIVASTSRVSDVAAAVLMKRFYRALKKDPPAVALQKARQIVKQFHPHPAWWANFSLVSGGSHRVAPLSP
jgi:CHAT domain-containing protein